MSQSKPLKRALRARIKALAAQQDARRLALEGEEICARLASHPRLQAATTVMAFWPLADEADIRPAILRLHAEGKRVVLPVVDDDVSMHVALYSPTMEMRLGALSVEEPVGEPFTGLDSIDVVLTPGRAFAPDGTRMGRGKGYYDRFLKLLPRAYKIGVGFAFQKIAAIPSEHYDVKMDEVI